jgi:hypothetical protein
MPKQRWLHPTVIHWTQLHVIGATEVQQACQDGCSIVAPGTMVWHTAIPHGTHQFDIPTNERTWHTLTHAAQLASLGWPALMPQLHRHSRYRLLWPLASCPKCNPTLLLSGRGWRPTHGVDGRAMRPAINQPSTPPTNPPTRLQRVALAHLWPRPIKPYQRLQSDSSCVSQGQLQAGASITPGTPVYPCMLVPGQSHAALQPQHQSVNPQSQV